MGFLTYLLFLYFISWSLGPFWLPHFNLRKWYFPGPLGSLDEFLAHSL